MLALGAVNYRPRIQTDRIDGRMGVLSARRA